MPAGERGFGSYAPSPLREPTHAKATTSNLRQRRPIAGCPRAGDRPDDVPAGSERGRSRGGENVHRSARGQRLPGTDVAALHADVTTEDPVALFATAREAEGRRRGQASAVVKPVIVVHGTGGAVVDVSTVKVAALW